MLGSLFLTLAVSAVVPLILAFLALPPAGRHARVAVSGASTRRWRLAAAAAGLALCGLGTATLLVAGPVLAVVATVLPAGSMLAWSGLDSGSWAVRGVVAWALVVTVAVGLLGWVGHRILDSTSAVGTAVGGIAWVVLLLSMTRLGRYTRERIAERARQDVSDQSERQPRPLAAALALLAASAVAVAVITAPTDDSPPAQAGRGGQGDGAGLSKTKATKGASIGAGSATPTPAPGRAGSSRGERPPVREQSEDPSGSASTAPTSSSPSPTGPPAQAPTDADKTPGYLKDKPNRPDKAPSPGSGNPHGR